MCATNLSTLYRVCNFCKLTYGPHFAPIVILLRHYNPEAHSTARTTPYQSLFAQHCTDAASLDVQLQTLNICMHGAEDSP
jgi:hypothetical protein